MRTVVVWNPGATTGGETGLAPQSLTEATATLAAALIEGGHRTLAFTRSRKGVELAWARMRQLLDAAVGDLVHPYRAGYLVKERREIEAELFAGTLRGVVATSALELGIDVGSLDAVVCGGFPGTVASFHQQIGRAAVAQARQSQCWSAARISWTSGWPDTPATCSPGCPNQP